MSFNAVVFPGQGSQRKGMARDFCDAFSESREVFQEASRALGYDVEELCWNDDPRLDLTEFTQPCILTAEIAMFEALRNHGGLDPVAYGGHSLGEYTALVASGAIPLEIALRLVQVRGRLMQNSAPAGVGAMAAVILDNLPHSQIDALAQAHEVDFANDNSASQIVLSGATERIDAVCARLVEAYPGGTMRIVPLSVSAPFHSRHMAEVESLFAKVLENHAPSFHPSAARCVVSNYTGTFHTGGLGDLVHSLVRQVSGRVRWRENMAALAVRSGAIVEIGPNRPLSGFFKSAGFAVPAIIDLRTARRAIPGFLETHAAPIKVSFPEAVANAAI